MRSWANLWLFWLLDAERPLPGPACRRACWWLTRVSVIRRLRYRGVARTTTPSRGGAARFSPLTKVNICLLLSIDFWPRRNGIYLR